MTLSLDGSLREGASYTLSYRRPDQSPLRLDNGDDIPSFAQAVNNRTDVAPTLVSAIGDDVEVVLTFDQPLDATSSIGAEAFAITAADSVTVNSTSVQGERVTLLLSRSLVEDEAATLAYTQPAEGGIADKTGHAAASFSASISNVTDTAPVPVSGVIHKTTITIILDQDIYDDPRFHDADGYPTDHFSLLGTDATVTFVAVSNDGPGGVGQIVITTTEAIPRADNARVRYFPSSGNISIRDDDAGKNRAKINDFLLEHAPTPPLLLSATIKGASASLTFDQKLDASAVPSGSSFILAPGDLIVSSVSIDAATVTLTLNKTATEDKSYTLTYTPPTTNALRNDQAIDVEAFAISPNNLTDYAPFPESVITDEHGTEIRITFDQRIDPKGTPDAAWFSTDPALSIDKAIVDPNDNDEQTILLLLNPDSLIKEGSDLLLSYDPPEGRGLRDDDAGNPVEAFYSKEVMNIVDVAPLVESAEVRGRILTVTFDQGLDEGHVPPPFHRQEPVCPDPSLPPDDPSCDTPPDINWFTVTGKTSTPIDVNGVDAKDRAVTLTLTERIQREVKVALSYKPQAISGVSYNLRDRSTPAHPVLGFDKEVTNLTSAYPTTAELFRDEPDRIEIEFDGQLSPDTVDHSAFQVTVNGEIVGILGAVAEGDRLLVELASDVAECDSISVSYTQAVAELLDAQGRRVEDFWRQVSQKIDRFFSLACTPGDDPKYPPEFVQGLAIGDSLFLTFDQPLLASDVSPLSFALALPGVDIDVRSVDINGSSVILELARSLPDDPEWIGLIYRAGRAEGLAGMIGHRVPSTVFALHNLTETDPQIESVVVNGMTVMVTFDERIGRRTAVASDFWLDAGGRRIEVASLDWQHGGVVMQLESRVTSLDAVALTYRPALDRGIWDTSGWMLEPVVFAGENVTPRPTSRESRIDDARIRAAGDDAAIALELARAFATDPALNLAAARGGGWSTVAEGDLVVAIDTSRIGPGLVAVRLSPVDDVRNLLQLLGPAPAFCSPSSNAVELRGWLLDGDPEAIAPVSVDGLIKPTPRSRACVFDLQLSAWRPYRVGQGLTAPALLLSWQDTSTIMSSAPTHAA